MYLFKGKNSPWLISAVSLCSESQHDPSTSTSSKGVHSLLLQLVPCWLTSAAAGKQATITIKRSQQNVCALRIQNLNL